MPQAIQPDPTNTQAHFSRVFHVPFVEACFCGRSVAKSTKRPPMNAPASGLYRPMLSIVGVPIRNPKSIIMIHAIRDMPPRTKREDFCMIHLFLNTTPPRYY